ncbi:UPF0607 protein [Plecturocebus cupreus]
MPHSPTAGPIQGHTPAPRSRTSLGLLESPAGWVGSLALCPLTPLVGALAGLLCTAPHPALSPAPLRCHKSPVPARPQTSGSRQPRQPQRTPLVRADFLAARVHPAAPARVPAPGALRASRYLYPQRGHGPRFPASWNITPNSSALLRDLPPLVWKPPSRKKPVLSPRNFVCMGPVRIPPMRRRYPLRLPLLKPLRHSSENSIPILKTEVRAEQQPEEPMEVDNQIDTRGQEQKGGPRSSGGAASTSRPLGTQGSLAFLDSSRGTDRSLTETTRTYQAQWTVPSLHSTGVPSVQSPAGGVHPSGMAQFPGPVLPGPVPGCSHWPYKAASQVLGKRHLPSSSGLEMEWEATPQRKDPVALAGSSTLSRAASHSSQQAKGSGQPQQLPPVPPQQCRSGNRPRPAPEGSTQNTSAPGRTPESRRVKKQIGKLKKRHP